ncbi:DUF418 domain-containing protein [Pseudoalteromonas luteoviolacea]|uniref:DUF418 domain-containing protein n=1 Tax=Pseudoalteromonas luteoviolacea TaxID=43657 RepID=UPI001150C2E6|nr:DUF418 domain-containing protein [Pseudoalteromonas luteoviolacea]TQF67429.1 DUF418 domain-containing protein [Pseudoalteromonas luteoviolacea]
MSRVSLVDALRGVALLGLPLTNLAYMADFNNGYIAADEGGLDAFLTFFIDVVAQGRFRTIFSILFGLSMCLFLEKHGNDFFTRKAQTRLYALGVIGCIHGFAIWPGDILVNYALSGLLLLYVIQSDSKTLVKLSVCTIVLPITLLAYLAFVYDEPTPLIPTKPVDGLLSFFRSNIEHFFEMLTLIPFLTLWYTFGLMVIGVLIYRAGWLQGRALSPLFCITVLIPLAVFGSISARWLFFYEHRIVFEVVNWLFAIPFCLALISLSTYIPRAKIAKGNVLVLAGRYSLSLYLLQSILGIVTFQLILQNLQLELRQIHFITIFVALTVLQLSLAWTLSYYKVMGPAERIFMSLQEFFQKRVAK